MLATQRHQQILSLLDNKGTMRTVDLADTFHVTHETIRRDLLSLSDEGLLTRIHGGACSLSYNLLETTVNFALGETKKFDGSLLLK